MMGPCQHLLESVMQGCRAHRKPPPSQDHIVGLRPGHYEGHLGGRRFLVVHLYFDGSISASFRVCDTVPPSLEILGQLKFILPQWQGPTPTASTRIHKPSSTPSRVIRRLRRIGNFDTRRANVLEAKFAWRRTERAFEAVPRRDIKAQRLFYASTLGSRVIKQNTK